MVRRACMIIMILTALFIPVSADTSASLQIVGIVQPQIHIQIHSRHADSYAYSSESSEITTIDSSSNYNGGYHLSVASLTDYDSSGMTADNLLEMQDFGALLLLGDNMLYLGDRFVQIERDGYYRITVTAR